MSEAITAPVTNAASTPAQAPAAGKVDAPQSAPKADAQAAGNKASEEAPKQPTAAEIRKMKLKIDNSDVELSEDEVIKLAQQSGAAQKRFQEAAAERKKVEQVLEFLTANPKEALSRLGIDVRKFAEETVADYLKRDAETPEQKQLREAQEKLQKYEAQEKERDEAAKKKAADEAEAKQRQANAEKEAAIVKKYDELFVTALNKSGLPKTPYTVARMATLQRINLKNKMDLSADKLAELVKEDYDKEFKSRLPKSEKGDLDGEKLIAMFGEDVINAITKAKIAKLKGAKLKHSAPVEQPPLDTSKQVKTDSWRHFQKRNRQPGTPG